MKNTIFTWHPNDFVKGLVMFVFTAVLAVVYNLTLASHFSFGKLDFHQLGIVAFQAAIGYLAMKFLQSSPTPNTEAIAGITLPAAVPSLPPAPETTVIVTGQIVDVTTTDVPS